MPSTPGGYLKRFGFHGGYDTRWAGTFQAATPASGEDPTAGVLSAHLVNVRVKASATLWNQAAKDNAELAGVRAKNHAFMWNVRAIGNV